MRFLPICFYLSSSFPVEPQITLSVQTTGCLLNIVFFPLNVGIFLNSASSAAALVIYLPSGGPSVKSRVHLLISREKRESPESGIYLKSSEKNNI